MEIVIALVAAGFGALVWHQRRHRPAALAASAFDEHADIALAVARHEAKQRGQSLGPLHVLYGLLQSDPIAAAIAQLDGNPDALVDRVLEVLERGASPRGEELVAHVAAVARYHGRPATCADLWSALAVNGLTSPIDATGITMARVLYVLAHGRPEPAVTAPAGLVEVVIHNDDFTRMEVVVAILREVFELDESLATTLMQQTHHAGRATIGRLPGSIAAQRITAAHARARAQGYPLWIEAVGVGWGVV